MPASFPRHTPTSIAGSVAFCEHSSPAYTGRTTLNAKSADLTCAAAADYSTPGERLTERVAGAAYLRLPLYLDADEAAERLIKRLALSGARSLNIAGNGIYTLTEKGWSQEKINDWMEEALFLTLQRAPIDFIVSGGQTGVDMAGAIAACALSIPAVITLPKGFIQRAENGFDAPRDPYLLASQTLAEAGRLITRRSAVPTRGAPTP